MTLTRAPFVETGRSRRYRQEGRGGSADAVGDLRKKMIFIARAGTTRVLTSRRAFPPPTQVLAQDIDLLNPPAELEASKHKLKRLVQAPNSFFMDVKCQVSLVFSLCARSARALSRRRVDDASNASTDRSPSFIVVHPSSGLLQHHHGFLSLANRRALRLVLGCVVPADRW